MSAITESQIRAALAREVTKLARQEQAVTATKATLEIFNEQLRKVTEQEKGSKK